jgi:hypothetical protein
MEAWREAAQGQGWLLHKCHADVLFQIQVQSDPQNMHF